MVNIAAHNHATTVGFLTGRPRPQPVRGDPHRGETMDESERVVFLTTPSKGDGVRSHVEKAVETHGKRRNLLLKQLPHMETAIETLRNGNGDILAMSAFDWEQFDTKGLTIVGHLSRKEPTWVLVGEDKPEYLQRDALLVCNHELVRRQMRRLRNDVNLVSLDEVVKRLNLEQAFAALDPDEVWPWVEWLRTEGHIAGFIVPRTIHADHRMKSRRHTLGLQRDPSEDHRERFIPPPLHGFTLLVARDGFPKGNLADMTDPSAELAYRMEHAIINGIDPHLRDLVGAYVEQRKISTFLKNASDQGDETMLNTLVDPNKKRGAYRGGPRVEMLIETLNSSGTVTAACERIVLPENSHIGMVNLLKEFMELLTIMTREHETSLRRIPGMPEGYHEAKQGLLDLDE